MKVSVFILSLLFFLQSFFPVVQAAERNRVSLRVERALLLREGGDHPLVLELSTFASLASTETAIFQPGAITVRKKGESPSSIARRGISAGDDTADDLDDYDEETGGQVISDPFEGWNRFWFRFNDRFYCYVADPLYRGWQTITPQIARTGLKNFFHNALFPVRFVNNLLQFKFLAAGVEFSRFMLNTMCSAGFADPAASKKTIIPVDPIGEDFGQTLGFWGVGHGPYLVWPFIGPSSFRETLGRIGDIFAEPFFYVQPWWASTASAMTLRFNNLDEVLPLYLDLKGAALDPYIAMREAYINYRNQHVAK